MDLKNLPPGLTEKEFDAYKKYVESGKPSLSPKTSAELLHLYLQGYSVSDIFKLNPALGLGIIVKARVDHNWDQQKDEYILGLMSQVREIVQKTQLESIRFANDGMAVYHKLVGDRYRRYLQTGVEADLGDLANMTFTQYKNFAELALKLTGQKVERTEFVGQVTHTHVGTGTDTKVADVINAELPDDPVEILKLVEGKKL